MEYSIECENEIEKLIIDKLNENPRYPILLSGLKDEFEKHGKEIYKYEIINNKYVFKSKTETKKDEDNKEYVDYYEVAFSIGKNDDLIVNKFYAKATPDKEYDSYDDALSGSVETSFSFEAYDSSGIKIGEQSYSDKYKLRDEEEMKSFQGYDNDYEPEPITSHKNVVKLVGTEKSRVFLVGEKGNLHTVRRLGQSAGTAMVEDAVYMPNFEQPATIGMLNPQRKTSHSYVCYVDEEFPEELKINPSNEVVSWNMDANAFTFTKKSEEMGINMANLIEKTNQEFKNRLDNSIVASERAEQNPAIQSMHDKIREYLDTDKEKVR